MAHRTDAAHRQGALIALQLARLGTVDVFFVRVSGPIFGAKSADEVIVKRAMTTIQSIRLLLAGLGVRKVMRIAAEKLVDLGA